MKFQRKKMGMSHGGSLKYGKKIEFNSMIDMVEYRVRNGIKHRKFKELYEGEVEDLQHHWDSDEDLADHKFELNEQFDL